MKYLAGTLFLSVLLLAASCKKPGGSNITGGGKGGNVTLIVSAEHANIFVDSCIFYIKYGTNNAPPNGIYDDSVTGILVDTTAISTFTNLTEGIYYVYAAAYHANYNPAYYKGGLPLTIFQQNTAKDTIYKIVPVAPAY